MVPRSPLIRFSVTQVLLVGALLINNVIADVSVNRAFGGHNAPFNPVGLDLAAGSYFLEGLWGSDVSEKMALVAISSYTKKSHSAAFYLANLEVALARINKNVRDFAGAEPYAKVAMAGYYDLAKKHHRHGRQGQPLELLCAAYSDINQPELAMQTVRYQIARLEEQKQELQCQNQHIDYMRLAEVYDIGSTVNYELGYYVTAEEYSRKALIYSRMSSDHVWKHIDHFMPEFQIAMALIKQEKYAEALPYAEAFDRKMQQRYVGNENTSAIMLALLYAKTGCTDDSQSMFGEEAGQAFEATFNDNKSVPYCTATSLYADLLDARGNHQRAANFMQRTVSGLDNSQVSVENQFKCKNRLAEYLLHAGSPSSAITLIERTKAAREARLGSFSLDTARTYALLAEAEAKLGQSDNAFDNLERAIKIETLLLNPDGPLITRHWEEAAQLFEHTAGNANNTAQQKIGERFRYLAGSSAR